MQKSNEQRLIELNIGLDNIRTDLTEIKATIKEMLRKPQGCVELNENDEGSGNVPLSLRGGK